VGDAYSFDPVMLGDRECDAWVHYYRREWAPFLRASLGLVSAGFGMGPRRTVVGAWLVLRANQVWAPYPENDPDAARELMRRFYALVVADGNLDLDPVEAARREVHWWHVHRLHQRADGIPEAVLRSPRPSHDSIVAPLVDAVADLYAYVYAVPGTTVREAARLRVAAMGRSDAWVAAGCSLSDPTLVEERRTLIASYSALRGAIDTAGVAGYRRVSASRQVRPD
jgi:hypothetical protein